MWMEAKAEDALAGKERRGLQGSTAAPLAANNAPRTSDDMLLLAPVQTCFAEQRTGWRHYTARAAFATVAS